MRSVTLLLLAVLILNIKTFAADTIVKGHLSDAACSAIKARKPGFAAKHSVACMRMGRCEASGYGVLTNDNQFIKFDKEGNEKALKFLGDVTKQTDIKVAVTGVVTGDQMTVSKIELQ